MLVFTQKLFGHFPKPGTRMNTQRERKLGKFHSFKRLSFVRRTLLRLLHNLMESKIQAGMSDKARNVEAKDSHEYYVISSTC